MAPKICDCDGCKTDREIRQSFDRKKYKNKECGKIGCGKPAVIEGWKGSLKVYACDDHYIEVEDILGHLPPRCIKANVR